MFGKKEGYPELASDEYKNTNFLNLNRENTVYFSHIIAAMVALYFVLIHDYKNKIPTPIIIIVVFICFSIFLQLYIFEDAVKNAFKIGKPKDNSINWVWDDGTKKWYNDVPFFLMWMFALYYGLHIFKLKGTLMNFTFEIPKVFNKISKFIFLIPLFGFIYYINYIIIQKGELIKPLPDRLYGFERPLAFTFSLAFIPMLCLLTFKNNLLTSIFTNRIIACIFLIASLYIVVWRLNGGLFLKKPQFEKLKEALRKYDSKKNIL